MADVAAIVLAAGLASRYRAAGGVDPSKLLAAFQGKPLVRWAIETALASRARPVIVITGHEQAAVAAALDPLPVTRVFNPEYATGLSSSLRVGLATIPASARGMLVMLGDMPLVTSALLDQLIAVFAADATADAVVPVLNGERGNPALLARSLFPAIAHLGGDKGARSLFTSDRRIVEIVVADDAAFIDIDTPDALTGLRP